MTGLEFPPVEDIDTSFGFKWRGVEVERLAVIRESKVLGVKAGNTRLEIYVSPTGRSVRVYKNGRELK